jgi:hypothetical protein
MIDDPFDNSDHLGMGDELPPLPVEPADDDPASPFAVALVTVAGMSGVRALRRAWHRRRDEDVAAAHAEPQPAAPRPAPDDTLASRPASERAALVALCIELDDLLSNDALREKLRRGLRRVGVDAVVPDGARFDPEAHRAIGTAAAPDPASERIIARVERPGFRDRGVDLRPPEVIVYSSGVSDRHE